jgi:hypothetical protein
LYAVRICLFGKLSSILKPVVWACRSHGENRERFQNVLWENLLDNAEILRKQIFEIGKQAQLACNACFSDTRSIEICVLLPQSWMRFEVLGPPLKPMY